MNTKQLAEKLNDSQYPVRISKDLREAAADAGLVIVFGASDDLMEFRGAENDEVGCYDGGSAMVDSMGLLPDRESIGDDEVLEDYFRRKRSARKIEALWCEEPDCTWTYRTGIPHETFEVMRDGDLYCRGIVFALADVEVDP